MDRLIDTCLQVLMEKTRPTIVRISAAAYLGSFTARAAHMPSNTVLSIFSSLSVYAERQRKDLGPACRDPGAPKYSVYYAAIQALLYIFCFRWRDLLSDTPNSSLDLDDEDLALDLEHGNHLPWSPGLKPFFSTHLLGNRLNPLKICAPEIVGEFARIACHLRFMYVYQVIEANKRVRSAGQQMEAVFPFDPLRLPRSRKWVEDVYNEWRGVPGLDRPNVEEVPESGDEGEGSPQADAGAEDEDEEEEGDTTPEDED